MALMVKSVEFIEVALTGTTSGIDLTSNQNPDNCVPFMTLHGAGDYQDNHCMDVWFSGGTSSGVINFQRDETRSVDMNIKCYVVEFDPAEVKVQHGSFSALPGASTTAYDTPESFDQTKTAMVHYWQSTDGSQRWGRALVRGRVLSNGTQVDMYRGASGGTVSGHYFLFEDISAGNDHFVVDHQTRTVSSTATNNLIPEGRRDPTRTFIIGSFAATNDSGPYSDRQTARIYTYFKSFSRCDRDDATSTVYSQIQHVTFQDQSKVYVIHQSYTGFGTGTTTFTNTWSKPCNLALSTIVATVPMGVSRGTSTAAAEIDSLWCSMKLNSSTECQFQRNSTGGSRNSYFGYSIVDWGGLVINTGSNPSPLDPDITPVKSVENFRITVDAYHEYQALSKGQAIENCAVFASQRGSGATGNQIREHVHDVWLRDPGIVVAHRNDATGDGIVDVSVVEFYPDQVRVQMSDWYMWGTTTEAVTISGVADTENAFILSKWEANDATYWSRIAVRSRFTANDTVEFYRYDAGNMVNGTFFVVEDLQDNFRVSHYVASGDTISFYVDEYHGYYETLHLASFATSNSNYYVDRNCMRVYHTGNGGRCIMDKDDATGTTYGSFQWVRFLDQRRHTHPFATTMNTSTTSNTLAVSSDLLDHKDSSITTYNPMQMSVGRGDATGADDMRGVFHTYRLINSNTEVENSRDAAVGVNLYSSYGGIIDWIGYTHPDANAKHELTYASPNRSLVKSIEKFTYNGTGRILLQYLTQGQRPENCVPFSSKRIGLNANEVVRMMRFHYIDQNSKMTSEGEGGGVGGDLDEVTYVVEFDPDQVRVQQIYKRMTGTTGSVTIPQEVDLTKTFMIFGYSADNWGNRWDWNAITGSFVSSTELNFSRYASSAGIYLSIYLVECLQDQWYVTHVDGGIDGDTTAYDYVNWREHSGNRLIQGSYSIDGTGFHPDRNCYRLYPDNLQGYIWNRNNTTGNLRDRHLEVVEFNPELEVKVSGFFIDMATGQTVETKGTLFEDGVDPDRSIVFPSIQNSINRADGTGVDDLGSVCVKVELTDADTVTSTRYDKGITTYGYGQVIEWPPYKTHYFEGTVTERGLPVSRRVTCYREDNDNLMDTTTSASGTGYYRLETSYSGTHYIICQDDEAGIDYKDLILSRMDPAPIT